MYFAPISVSLYIYYIKPYRCHQQKTVLVQDPICMFLVRWLLFRMMFASGVVKVNKDYIYSLIIFPYYS